MIKLVALPFQVIDKRSENMRASRYNSIPRDLIEDLIIVGIISTASWALFHRWPEAIGVHTEPSPFGWLVFSVGAAIVVAGMRPDADWAKNFVRFGIFIALLGEGLILN